jgi:hypothetical protein
VKQVRGLEVAVHDAQEVRLGDGLACLQHVVDGLGRVQTAATLEHHVQVLTLEELHDDVGRSRLERVDVEDARDVLGADSGGCARLLQEAMHRGVLASSGDMNLIATR